MYDYKLMNPHVYEIVDNMGEKAFCVKGKLAIDSSDPDLTPRQRLRLKAMNGKKIPTETVFTGDIVLDDGDLITRFRQLLPSTGTWVDETGKQQPWLGLKTLTEGEAFTHEDYMKACDVLFQEGYTFLPNGMYVTVPLDEPVVQTFSRNFGKNAEGKPLFKIGEPVCYAKTKKIKVFKELQIFVRINDGGLGADIYHHSYVPGFDYATRRDSKLRLFTPKSDFAKRLSEWPGYEFAGELATATADEIANPGEDAEGPSET